MICPHFDISFTINYLEIMIKIFTTYKPREVVATDVNSESDTVQGLVTSMSMILNGMDDNSMQSREMSYSGDSVVDLYPEAFGRPTKYELDYYAAENAVDGPGGPSDINPEPPSASAAQSAEVENAPQS